MQHGVVLQRLQGKLLLRPLQDGGDEVPGEVVGHEEVFDLGKRRMQLPAARRSFRGGRPGRALPGIPAGPGSPSAGPGGSAPSSPIRGSPLLLLHVDLPFLCPVLGEVAGHLHALRGRTCRGSRPTRTAAVREDAGILPVGDASSFLSLPCCDRAWIVKYCILPLPRVYVSSLISPSASTAMSGATSRLEMTARCGISRAVLDFTSGRAASEQRTTSW